MPASLYDSALLHHQDLIGPAYGRKAVGDHKGGAAAHEELKTGLNEDEWSQ